MSFNGKSTAGIIRENKARLLPQTIQTHAYMHAHARTHTQVLYKCKENTKIYKKMTSESIF